ncbi:hypothetical protein JHK84_038886 [Glycine max]|nr:hypothetical protein JHK85_039236 [Glycine max]KAG5120546.1 hypothetical protein JHK84_038886 [Glycine max]
MVEARRVQGSVLKHMVEAINEMSVNCANFNFSRAGFSLLAMDPTQTAMAEIFLRSDTSAAPSPSASTSTTWPRSSVPPPKMTPSPSKPTMAPTSPSSSSKALIERKLACCSKDSCAVVCVIAQDLISHFMMNLVDIDTKPVLIHSEAQYYHAIVKMPSAKFSRICTDLSIFGDTVSIEVTEEGVGFSTKRDIGTSIIFCWHNTSVHKADEEATAIEMTQTVSLNFGLTFLNSFTKATPLSNTVTIFLSNQLHLPVVFQYQIGGEERLESYTKPNSPNEIRYNTKSQSNGNRVSIHVTDKGTLMFSTIGDFGISTVLRKHEPFEVTLIKMTQPVSLKFEMRCVDMLRKATLLSDTLTIDQLVKGAAGGCVCVQNCCRDGLCSLSLAALFFAHVFWI